MLSGHADVRLKNEMWAWQVRRICRRCTGGLAALLFASILVFVGTSAQAEEEIDKVCTLVSVINDCVGLAYINPAGKIKFCACGVGGKAPEEDSSTADMNKKIGGSVLMTFDKNAAFEQVGEDRFLGVVICKWKLVNGTYVYKCE